MIPVVESSSYNLDDHDLTQPGVFSFSIIDRLNTIGLSINDLDEVMWVKTQVYPTPYTILYRGFVRQLDFQVVANYTIWKVTCADVSEVLDYSKPIVADNRPAERSVDRLQYFLGKYGTVTGISTGTFINLPSLTPQPKTAFQRETLRTVVEKAISLEATGFNYPLNLGVVSYYLDYYYQLHVFTGLGDVPGPYALTDATPTPVGSAPFSVSGSYDGTSDADGVYVTGSNATGSGLVMSGVPRWPNRFVTLDVTTSTTPQMAQSAGLAELGRRQNLSRLSVVVTGYDGWAKGQSVAVTNQALRLNGNQYWIQGVSMKVLSGTGYREYTLQLNSMKPRFSRLVAAFRRGFSSPVLGSSVMGQIGG
jgi:hypothetical protein